MRLLTLGLVLALNTSAETPLYEAGAITWYAEKCGSLTKKGKEELTTRVANNKTLMALEDNDFDRGFSKAKNTGCFVMNIVVKANNDEGYFK